MYQARRFALMPLMAMVLAATAGAPPPEERIPRPPPPPPRPPQPPRTSERDLFDAADEVLSPRGLVVDRYTGPIAPIDDAGRAHKLPFAASGAEVVLGSDEALREALKDTHQARMRGVMPRPARTREDLFEPLALLPVVQQVAVRPPAKHGRKPRTRRERQRQRERGGR